MRNLALLLLLLRCASSAASAQASAPLTVEEAVALAVKNSPRLSAATREALAARSGVRSAQALANPEIVFTPSITVSGSDEELLVRQPLELNGTRAARTGIARAELRRVQAQAAVELGNLVFETKTAYYELARARELLALAADLLKTAEDFDRRVRRLVEEGKHPGIELAQTGIEVARARQQVTQATAQAEIAQAALNTLLGRPASAPVGPLTPLAFTPHTVDAETAVRQALEARAEILAAEAEADAFRQEARLARAEGLPDLAPQFRAGSVTRGFREHGVGIGVTLPLFDYGSRRHRIRQAEEAARARADRASAVRSLVRQEVQQAVARLRAAEAVVRDYQQGILERARRLLDASRISLTEGQASILTALEAQRTYRAVQTEYTNALVSHAEARAELERATGSAPASLPGKKDPERSLK